MSEFIPAPILGPRPFAVTVSGIKHVIVGWRAYEGRDEPQIPDPKTGALVFARLALPDLHHVVTEGGWAMMHDATQDLVDASQYLAAGRRDRDRD